MSRWQTLAGGPLTIVVGELLLVVCSVFYLLWWTLTYKPAGRTPPGSGLLLGGAVLGGLGGLVLLGVGVAALLPRASGLVLGATVAGGVLVGAALVHVSSSVLHRPVTTELPLIVLWATAQLAAGTTMSTSGVLRPSAAAVWVTATILATLVGLACYLAFYRLDPVPAYRLGMVPLAVDGVVAAVLALVVVLERTS